MATHQTDRVGFTFNRLGQVTAETHFEGLLSGIAVGSGFDAAGRRESLNVTQGGNPIYQASYGYAGDLLQTVGYGNLLATYQYEPSSALLKSITFSQNGQNRLTLTRFYDTLNRLTKIEAVANGQTISSQHSYGYNLANQRTVVTNADNSRWNFEYDDLGQVISGKRRWADANPVLGQQFEYGFDDIGNRLWTKAGGDGSGQNLRQSDYVPNLLNQYLSRTVPGFAEVQGSAGVGATVTVNHAPTERQGEYYRKELAVANAGQPVWLSVTNMAVVNQPAKDVITTTEGRLYVPPATETFAYDADGNLIRDGRWEYAWDAENRLIGMETAPGAAAAGVPRQKLAFQYDWQGRRIAKTVYGWQTDHWSLTSDLRFVYDGWNLVAILDGNSQLLYSFVWGTDLSGTMQGAGGVGGLLSMTVHLGPQAGDYFYCYDGNGNVAALINAQSSELSAQYEYGPFGEFIRATGPVAKANPFRFSTKFHDDETGLVYYGYRYYNSSLGRWLSRDPIEENGGHNLTCFVANDPLNMLDYYGLTPCNKVGERKIVSSEALVLPGTWELSDQEITKKKKELINWLARARYAPFKKLESPLLTYVPGITEMAYNNAFNIAIEQMHGAKLFTRVKYHVCTEKTCYNPFSKRFRLKWLEYGEERETEWRQCPPEPETTYPQGVYFGLEDAYSHFDRCRKDHEKYVKDPVEYDYQQTLKRVRKQFYD